MTTTYQGKCECGSTTWEAVLPSDVNGHVLCHCTTCQNLSGGAFTLNQIIPKDNFKLKTGNLKVYTYKGASGNDVHCYMCENCAASPYHHQTVMGPNIVIRTGLLEGTQKWPKPAFEIFGAAKLPWQPQTADAIVPGAPPA